MNLLKPVTISNVIILRTYNDHKNEALFSYVLDQANTSEKTAFETMKNAVFRTLHKMKYLIFYR